MTPLSTGRARLRTPRRLLVAATSALLLFTSHASASSVLPPPLDSVIAQPTVPKPNASADADTSRFVALWDSRFRSGPAFQAYLDSDAEYDDGWNAAPDERKRELVAALVDHWRATSAEFAASVDWTAPATREGGETPSRYEIAGMVYSIVFHKEAFKEAIRQPDEGGSTGTPDGEVDPGPTPPDTLGEAATAALAGASVKLNVDLGIAALDAITDPDLAERLVETVPVDAFDRLPTTGDIAGVDLGELGDTLAPLAGPLGSLASLRQAAPQSAYAPAALGPDNLTYGVCWQRAGGAEVCPITPYVVGLLGRVPGTSALVDVDANPSTGLLGHDLEISLSIDPLTTPGGLAASVVVKAHSTVGKATRGLVRYNLPDSDKEARVGFNGLTTALQTTQSATVLFESLAGLSTGDSRTRASVSHSGGNGGPTVVLETSYAGGATPDSLAAVTTFVRAPSSFTARLAAKHASNGTKITQVEVTHSSGTLPDVTVDASARLGAAQVVGHVALTKVPTSTSITETADPATKETRVSYTASSSLTKLSAGVAVVPNVSTPGTFTVAALSLASLPKQITLTIAPERMTYSADANGGALQAGIDQYTGSVVNKQAYVGLSSVPISASATLTSSAQRYVLDSAPGGIATVKAGYRDDAAKLNVGLDINGFPGHAELTMPSGSDQRIAWTASAATTSVLVNAKYGAWTGYLNVTNVPRSMSIVPGTANVDVSATGGAGATITAWLSNYGSHFESPYSGDNWVTAGRLKLSVPVMYGQTVTATLVSAAVRIHDLTRLRVTPGTDTTLDLEAGGGKPLFVKYVNEDLVAKRRSLVEARLVDFPGKVTASFGTSTTVRASANTDLTAYVEHGPITTGLAAVPNPHGVAVRRSLVGGVPLVRARVRLTGLPTLVEVGPGSVNLSGIRPKESAIEVDIVVDDPANPVTAYASLSGIATYSQHGITLSWSTGPIAGGHETVVQAATGGAPFGALTVRLTYGTYSARLDTSTLPSSMKATISEFEGRTKVSWNASAPISSVTAALGARSAGATTWTARAALTLTDVPAVFELTTGRDGGGGGPVVSYQAGAGTLDVTLTADGSLKQTNTSLAANLFFRITNLAPKVDIVAAGKGFTLTGTGRTGSIEAKVSANASISAADASDPVPDGWVTFPWSYELGITAKVENLNVALTNVAAFTVAAGITTQLSGDYGTFLFRWDGFNVDLRARGTLKMRVNFPGIGGGSFDIVKADLATQFGINPVVRIYAPGWHNVYNGELHLVCWHFSFSADVQPTSLGNTTFTQGISLTGTPGSTHTRWITPVAFGWNTLSDVVTGVSIYGKKNFVRGGFTQWWDCSDVDWWPLW